MSLVVSFNRYNKLQLKIDLERLEEILIEKYGDDYGPGEIFDVLETTNWEMFLKPYVFNERSEIPVIITGDKLLNVFRIKKDSSSGK